MFSISCRMSGDHQDGSGDGGDLPRLAFCVGAWTEALNRKARPNTRAWVAAARRVVEEGRAGKVRDPENDQITNFTLNLPKNTRSYLIM